MKQLILKNSFIPTFLFLTLLFFSSCEKTFTDELIEQELQEENLTKLRKSSPVCTALFDNITVEDGKLKFIDEEHLKDVFECLEDQVEAHNDAFDAQNPTMTPDELDEYAEEIGFNQWQPLIDFEENFEYSSRRRLVHDQLLTWLEDDILDPNTNPQLEDGGVSPIFRTLLNVNGSLYIGSTKYSFGKSFFNPNCSAIRSALAFKLYDNKDKLFVMTTYINGVVPSFFIANTTVSNFKKKSGGGWKLSRARIFVQVGGKARRFSNCSVPLAFGKFNSAKTRSIRSVTNIVMGNPPKTLKKQESFGFTTVGSSSNTGTTIL